MSALLSSTLARSLRLLLAVVSLAAVAVIIVQSSDDVAASGAPTISSVESIDQDPAGASGWVTPARYGPLGGRFRITGANFPTSSSNSATVTVGGQPCGFFGPGAGQTATEIVVSCNNAVSGFQALTAGTHDVVVTDANGTATAANALEIIGDPVVTSVTPNGSDTTGGVTITVTGSGFGASPGWVQSVVVQGMAFMGGLCRSVVVSSDTSLTCVVPSSGSPGAAEAVDVTVTTWYFTSGSGSGAFTYRGPAVTSITPATGTAAGGTSVTIAGSDFTTGSGPVGTSVSIGGVACSVTSVTATQIECSTGASNTLGAANVVVTSNGVAGTLTSGFAYSLAAPGVPGTPTAVAGDGSAAVTVVAPSSGGTPASYTVTASPGGTTCTVTGATGSCTISGLSNGTSYTFTATATNSGGTSSASAASTSVTPAAASSGGSGGSGSGGSGSGSGGSGGSGSGSGASQTTAPTTTAPATTAPATAAPTTTAPATASTGAAALINPSQVQAVIGSPKDERLKGKNLKDSIVASIISVRTEADGSRVADVALSVPGVDIDLLDVGLDDSAAGGPKPGKGLSTCTQASNGKCAKAQQPDLDEPESWNFGPNVSCSAVPKVDLAEMEQDLTAASVTPRARLSSSSFELDDVGPALEYYAVIVKAGTQNTVWRSDDPATTPLAPGTVVYGANGDDIAHIIFCTRAATGNAPATPSSTTTTVIETTTTAAPTTTAPTTTAAPTTTTTVPPAVVDPIACAANAPGLVQSLTSGSVTTMKRLDIASGQYVDFSPPWVITMPGFGSFNAAAVHPTSGRAYASIRKGSVTYLIRFDRDSDVEFVARLPFSAHAAEFTSGGDLILVSRVLRDPDSMPGFADAASAPALRNNQFTNVSLWGADIARLSIGGTEFMLGKPLNSVQVQYTAMNSPKGFLDASYFDVDGSQFDAAWLDTNLKRDNWGSAWSIDGVAYFAANSGSGLWRIRPEDIDLAARTVVVQRVMTATAKTNSNDGFGCPSDPVVQTIPTPSTPVTTTTDPSATTTTVAPAPPAPAVITIQLPPAVAPTTTAAPSTTAATTTTAPTSTSTSTSTTTTTTVPPTTTTTTTTTSTTTTTTTTTTSTTTTTTTTTTVPSSSGSSPTTAPAVSTTTPSTATPTTATPSTATPATAAPTTAAPATAGSDRAVRVKALVTTHIETVEVEFSIDTETLTIVDSDIEVASLPMSGGESRPMVAVSVVVVLLGGLLIGLRRRLPA